MVDQALLDRLDRLHEELKNRAILEEVMNQIMYDIPSDPTIVKVSITEGCVKDKEPPELTRDLERTQRPKLGKATLQVERSGRRDHGRAG